MGAAALALGGAGIVGNLIGGYFASSAAKKAAAIQAAAARQVAAQARQDATFAGQGAYTAAGDAANRVTTATGESADLLSNLYNSRLSDIQPYQRVGTTAANALEQALPDLTRSFAPDMLQDDPGYQFRLDQGMRALQASAAARGGGLGGGAAKSVARYSQDYASGEYEKAFERFQAQNAQRFGILSGSVGIGQRASDQAQAATMGLAAPIAQQNIAAAQYGGNALQNAAQLAGGYGMEASRISGEAISGGANAQAAGQVGAANAWNQGIGGAVNAGLGAYALYQYGKRPTTPRPFNTGSITPGIPGYRNPGLPTPPYIPSVGSNPYEF